MTGFCIYPWFNNIFEFAYDLLIPTGAFVIGTTSTEAKAAKARESGADEVILYSQKDFVEEVNRITDGKGVNVIYDGVGKTTLHRGTVLSNSSLLCTVILRLYLRYF